MWHSIVVYFVPVCFLDTNSIFLYDSTHMDFVGMGLTILHNVIVVVNLKVNKILMEQFLILQLST